MGAKISAITEAQSLKVSNGKINTRPTITYSQMLSSAVGGEVDHQLLCCMRQDIISKQYNAVLI